MKEYVLWLDVSMDDITVMHELNCVADLFDDALNLLLGESALITQVSVNVPSAAEFQHKVQVFLIREISVKLNNVGVVEVALYFDLSDELVDVLFRLEDLLWDLLERT